MEKEFPSSNVCLFLWKFWFVHASKRKNEITKCKTEELNMLSQSFVKKVKVKLFFQNK